MNLNIKNTLKIGVVFLTISLFWQVYDSIISKIVDNIFNLSDSARGVVMSLDNIIALFLLPLFGYLSDRTKSKYGKRTPYIFWGTIFASISFLFVGVFTVVENFTGFMISLLFVLVFMSVYRSPAVALMPDITLKPLRTKANLVINVMGGAGSMVSLLIVAFMLKDKSSYMSIFVLVSVIMLASLIAFLLTVKEPKLVNELQKKEKELGLQEEIIVQNAKKINGKRLVSMIFLLIAVFMWFMSFNALMSSFSIFAERIWHIDGGKFTVPLIVAIILAMIITVPFLILGKKWSRKTSILVGITELIVSTLLIFLLCSNVFIINTDFSKGMLNNPMFYLASFLFGVCGSGWAIININSYPMVVEMSKNSTVGKYTGYYYTASMLAQIVTPFLSGIFTDMFSMKILFLYASVFALIAFVFMGRVTYGNGTQLKDKWKKFRAEMEEKKKSGRTD